MPWWQRQRGSQVFVFYRKDGRIRALPRSQTRHLDSLNDTAIEFWLAEWAQGRIQACSSSRKLRGYVDRYCGYLEQRGKAPKTVWEHRHSLIEHVLPFFLDGDAPLVDPNQWPAKSIRLHAYVTKERGRSDSCSRKAINALQHFYNFLVKQTYLFNYKLPL